MSFRICDVILCKKLNFVLVCFSGSVGKFQEPIVALCANFCYGEDIDRTTIESGHLLVRRSPFLGFSWGCVKWLNLIGLAELKMDVYIILYNKLLGLFTVIITSSAVCVPYTCELWGCNIWPLLLMFLVWFFFFNLDIPIRLILEILLGLILAMWNC